MIGQTGSGKSTFIQHLNGIIPVTGGKLTVGDINLADKKKIGLYKLINDRYLKREDMAAITEGIQLAVRDVIVAKQKGKKEMLFGYRDKITPLARRLTFSQLVSCYDAATKASDALAQNMNVAAVKATLSNDLWKTVL